MFLFYDKLLFIGEMFFQNTVGDIHECPENGRFVNRPYNATHNRRECIYAFRKAPLCKGSSAVGGEGLFISKDTYNPPVMLRMPPSFTQGGLSYH